MIGRIAPQTRFSALKVDADHLDLIKRQNADLGHTMAMEMNQRQYGQDSFNTGIRLLEQAGIDVAVTVAPGYINSPRRIEVELQRNGQAIPHQRKHLDPSLQDSTRLEDTTWGDIVHLALLKHLNILNLKTQAATTPG